MAEWLALISVGAVLVSIRLALWILPYSRVRGLIEGALPAHRDHAASQDDEYVARIAWAARVLGRRILGKRPCLPQALAAHLLLSRRGYPTQLRIGVAKEERGDLAAHAWLEYAGRVIVGGWSSPYAYRPLQ